ncbi:TolC family protein [Dyadobacter subterraneus]|uniref:TolC family protein n=1 Tax=Dyadobacter subterraneus TaxID=2773304 RepID=A0ABR9W815_9BACT|nr:TolC family protein [Dyadobacter subterraneus]MBE9461304.1 TolC family protein [Dyadobacter subterraneus]
MKNQKKIKLALTLLGLQLFLACKISKDLSIESASLPTTFRDNTTEDSISVAQMPWQSFFHYADLNTLISEALAHNNDMQMAIKNIESSALALRQAKLGNIPNLSFQINGLTNRPSDNSLNGLTLDKFLQTKHIEDYTLGPVLSWEADLWGKIKNQKALALASYLQTQEAKKAVQTRIVSDISKGFYNLLMLDAQLAIAKRNVQLTDSTLIIMKLQFNSGQITSLAIEQAQAQKLSAEKLIPKFEQDISIQENAISVLSGRSPSLIIRTLNLETINIPDSLSVGIPSELLTRRPDIKISELALSSANANSAIAKAAMYPSFILTAQGGLDAFKASNWFNIPGSLFVTALGSMTQPMFQQRKFRTQYEISLVKRQQSLIQFQQSFLIAVGEVSNALVKMDKLKQQQRFIFDRTEALRQAIQNSKMLFGNGIANYLEVITAQSNVLQSELELAAIKKDRLDANVDLYRSVGGGWN